MPVWSHRLIHVIDTDRFVKATTMKKRADFWYQPFYCFPGEQQLGTIMQLSCSQAGKSSAQPQTAFPMTSCMTSCMTLSSLLMPTAAAKGLIELTDIV